VEGVMCWLCQVSDKNIISVLSLFIMSLLTLIKNFVVPIIQYAAPLMVAACCKSLANSSIEECQQHAQRIRKGCLAAQWDALDGIAAIGHSFILGIKVYSSLAAAVTAIEMASTRTVELTIQSIAIQLPFMAEDYPGRLQLSSLRRWLGRTHGVTDRLPVLDGVTAINNYKNDLRTRMNTLKAIRLHQYYPINHLVPTAHRLAASLIDKILTSDRNSLEKHLILWRGYQPGRSEDRLCVCMEPFTQYYTTSCAELAGIPRFDIHEMIGQEKWAELDALLQQWWTICNAINII